MSKYRVEATMTITVKTEFEDDGKDLSTQAHDALSYDFDKGGDEEFTNIEITEVKNSRE